MRSGVCTGVLVLASCLYSCAEITRSEVPLAGRNVGACADLNGSYRYNGVQTEVDGRASSGLARLPQVLDPAIPFPTNAEVVSVTFTDSNTVQLDEHRAGVRTKTTVIGPPNATITCSKGPLISISSVVVEKGEIVNRRATRNAIISKSDDGGLNVRVEYHQTSILRTQPTIVIVLRFQRATE